MRGELSSSSFGYFPTPTVQHVQQAMNPISHVPSTPPTNPNPVNPSIPPMADFRRRINSNPRIKITVMETDIPTHVASNILTI